MDSGSISPPKKEVATDVDDLVNMGYPLQEVKKALNVTNGDRTAALRILAKGGVEKDDTGWRKQTADDWVSGVGSSGQSIHMTNRALQKSPIYIRVSAFVRKDYDVEYMMKVTLKNGKQWEIGRTYTQFSVFKGNLPLGTCLAFKNSFPMPSFFQMFLAEESTEFLIKRRDALGEWIRELTLNEECMNSVKILNLLYFFVDYKKHNGDIKEATPKAITATGPQVNSPLLTNDNEFEIRKNFVLQNIPIIAESRFPMTVNELRSALPYRIELKKLECGRQHIENSNNLNSKPSSGSVNEEENSKESTTSSTNNSGPTERLFKVDMKQLNKDLSRDRIIIQGKKISGSQTEVDDIVEIGKQAVMQVIIRSGHHLVTVKQVTAPPPPPPPGNYMGPPGTAEQRSNTAPPPAMTGSLSRHCSLTNVQHPPPPPPSTLPTGSDSASALQLLDNVVKAAMQQISRTESAYLSHASLHEMMDMHNLREMSDYAPFLIVPESTLAQPLVLNFRIQERNMDRKPSGIAIPSAVVPVAAAVDEEHVVRAIQPAVDITSLAETHSAPPIPVVALPQPTAASVVPPAPVIKEWCIVAEGEASTVYRVTDPETMKPIVQLRVTFIYTMFAIPVMDWSNSRVEKVVDFKLKEGKTYLVIAQDTTSTDRDW